ncbi:ceramide glucosyltransferase-B-like isoform X1 [Halichondria panicea]|uniref:ceramide glucosyltransferase-B-like isoform X1 n=1 Tax=Halichondria panicea TaxID=6063 RepID=UPI00312B8C86
MDGVLDYVVNALFYIFVIYNFSYLCLRWMVIISWKLKLKAKKELSNKFLQSQGVSIIKPLFGYDSNMNDNLESFFELNYPKFELLLCVGEKINGPSLPLITELRAKYPAVDVKVFQGGEDVGPNPKICNMMPGYRDAQYPLMWFSDSRIHTSPDNLTEMMSHIGDLNVALVHQMPFVSHVEGFAGYLDKAYFGTQFARMYLIGDLLNLNHIVGMSWLLKKDALEKVGGLKAFGEYLAEDDVIGQALGKSGYKLALSTKLAVQNSGAPSTVLFRERIIRWTKLRANMSPLFFMLEPITECLPNALILGFYSKSFGFSFLSFIALFITIWFLSDLVYLHVLSNGNLGSLWLMFLAWLYRESTAYWYFLLGWVSREVTWGGKRYRLLPGGKTARINVSTAQTV